MENKFLHTLKSCWLCLRFPFLYPRNRFTGRNKKYLLFKPLSQLYKKSVVDISITGKLEKENKLFYPFVRFFDTTVKLDKGNKKLTISNNVGIIEHSLKSLLWSDDRFDILGLSLTFTLGGNPIIYIHVKPKDETDEVNYGFHYEGIKLTINKFYKSLYNILDWIDKEIFDRILFIPIYTELDTMPSGWRKAFGIQMCEELKAQLKKDKYLYKYRIVQIKEKFGSLCWYDNGSSKEVQDIISKYENLSWNTCINCGKPSTKISSGWICPYCDEHFPKNSEVYQEKINGEWKTTHEYEMA